MFAIYSGYIKVLQNSFDLIEFLMANYIGVVALLLGIFLPSILGQSTKVCGYSQVQVLSQCTAIGGECINFVGSCGGGGISPVCIFLAEWSKAIKSYFSKAFPHLTEMPLGFQIRVGKQ